MLKPLLIATTTLFSAILVSINTANAATKPAPSQLGHQQLIAKGTKSTHMSAQRQSDIKSIHQALSQFYRGFNEYSFEAMASSTVEYTPAEKAYIEKLFKRIKSSGVDLSIEVQSIDLVELSARNAFVKINQNMKAIGPQRSGGYELLSKVRLVKLNGKWKIGDGYTVMKSVNRGV
jgi:hypothetical protein